MRLSQIWIVSAKRAHARARSLTRRREQNGKFTRKQEEKSY